MSVLVPPGSPIHTSSYRPQQTPIPVSQWTALSSPNLSSTTVYDRVRLRGDYAPLSSRQTVLTAFPLSLPGPLSLTQRGQNRLRRDCAYSDVRLVWQVPGANPLGPGKPGEGKAPTILENCELPGLQSLSGNNTGWTTRAFTAQRYKDDYCGPR